MGRCRHTQGTAMWRWGRGWSNTATSQGTLWLPEAEVTEGTSPEGFGRSIALPTAWFWISSLWVYERIMFWCFKLPSLILCIATLGNECQPLSGLLHTYLKAYLGNHRFTWKCTLHGFETKQTDTKKSRGETNISVNILGLKLWILNNCSEELEKRS